MTAVIRGVAEGEPQAPRAQERTVVMERQARGAGAGADLGARIAPRGPMLVVAPEAVAAMVPAALAVLLAGLEPEPRQLLVQALAVAEQVIRPLPRVALGQAVRYNGQMIQARTRDPGAEEEALAMQVPEARPVTMAAVVVEGKELAARARLALS